MRVGTGDRRSGARAVNGSEGVAPQDGRLLEARHLLERESISVLSLDVFDTLLWRIVPQPTDAFVLLGHRLRDEGVLVSHTPPGVFATLRRMAEKRARQRVSPDGVAEVRLEAIYDEMPTYLFGGLGVKQLADLEVRFERDITFPDLEVIALSRSALEQQGVRLVLVSDTYLSEGNIRELLDREPFTALDIFKVFTSSDFGVGKGSGLYDAVLETLAVPAREVLHIGDHPDSDVKRPAAAGIRTVFFDKYPKGLQTVLEREGVLDPPEASTSFAVHPHHGDLGLTALRSKTSAVVGASSVEDAHDGHWRFGATVLGPVFTGFAEWIHRRTEAEGVDTVYCIMREGEFLARMVNGARRYLGSGVRAKTLWLSRDVCARAAIVDGSPEEIDVLLNRRRTPTLRELCGALGIELDQLPELFDHAEGRLDDPELRRMALESIARRPDVRATIVLQASVLRKRLVDYFLGVIGGDEQRVVLADLGWAGTIQAYLDRALRAADVDIGTLGLYLLTNEAGADRMLDGVRLEGFLASAGVPRDAVSSFIRSPEIIEQACMVDEGSLSGFDGDGKPLHGPVLVSPSQAVQRTAVQSGILTFQREWARYRDVVPVDRRALDTDGRNMLLRMLVRFVVMPTRDEATMFSSWLHDEDYGSRKTDTVIEEDLVGTLRYLTPRQLLELPMTRVYWPTALAAIVDPPLAVAAGAIAEGKIPADAFESDEQVGVELMVDLGTGFVTNRTASARLNRHGLCFVREEIMASPVRALRIRFPGGPGVVRLDSLRFWLSSRGQSNPTAAEVVWPEQFRHLRFGGCVSLAGNLAYSAGGGLTVTYRFPIDLAPHVYKVVVEIGFGWLPTSPPTPGRPTAAAALKNFGRRVGKKAASVVIEGVGSVVAPDGGLTVERVRRMLQASGRVDASPDSHRPAH